MPAYVFFARGRPHNSSVILANVGHTDCGACIRYHRRRERDPHEYGPGRSTPVADRRWKADTWAGSAQGWVQITEGATLEDVHGFACALFIGEVVGLPETCRSNSDEESCAAYARILSRERLMNAPE